jgi:hypothetical protein
MSVSREQLEDLRQRLERLRAARAPVLDTGLAPADPAQPALALPGAAASAPREPETPASILELLAVRDRLIQADLMRLQRTLSRQNFRGAESARRLVRKLARKAEQNASDLEALMRSLG